MEKFVYYYSSVYIKLELEIYKMNDLIIYNFLVKIAVGTQLYS